MSIAKLAIVGAVSLGAIIGVSYVIKHKYESNNSLVKKAVILEVLKRAKTKNLLVLHHIGQTSQRLSKTLKISLQQAKAQIVNNQRQMNFYQSFDQNYAKACKQVNIQLNDFKYSYQFYLKNGDKDIKNAHDKWQNDFNNSLMGKPPTDEITPPAFLTKQKVLQIFKDMTYKTYFHQAELAKKSTGKSRILQSPAQDLIKEQQGILKAEQFNQNDGPPNFIYAFVLQKYKKDPQFQAKITKIQNHFSKIYGKYQKKISNRKISQKQIEELQDQLIYNSVIQ